MIKKSKGELVDSNGLAGPGESIFSKAHWDKLAEKEKNLTDKLKIKTDKRAKK